MRTDKDSWSPASGVGATATMAAAARAVASRAPDAVISDPFAESLVRAVGIDFFTRLASGDVDTADLDGPASVRRLTDGMTVRTWFFDDVLTRAGWTGIRQVVILASGLDTRAYRLQLPPGTIVFEIDQPEVIAFKTQALRSLGAVATADHRSLGIDLRGDWPLALANAGFDPSRPTAWIAEGLLGYLPPDSQDHLLDVVTTQSAPGSRFATDSLPNFATMGPHDVQSLTRTLAERWGPLGLDIDLSELVYLGNRHDVDPYLSQRGWDVAAVSTAELLPKCGLAPLGGDGDVPFAEIVYLSATRPEAETRNR